MKTKKFLNSILTALLLAVALCALAPALPAVTVTKWSDGTELTNTASWITNGSPAIPGSADTAMWTNSSLGAGLTLSGSKAWGGISVSNAASDINISGPGTLTNGTGGIDMSASLVNLTIATNPIVLSGAQTWAVNSNETLTVGGRVTGAQALTFSGQGTVAITNGILTGSTLNGANGTLNLTGPTNYFNVINLGNVNTAGFTAVENISAGTNLLTTLEFGNGNGRGIVNISGANTVINMSGSGNLRMGASNSGNHSGSGAIYQSGGTFNVSATDVLMAWANNSYGAYILSGGTLNGPNASWNVPNQNGPVGVFFQSGGASTFINSFNFDQNSLGGGFVDVSGGTMTHKTAGNFMNSQANAAGNSLGVLTVRGTGIVSEQTGNFLVTGAAATAGDNAYGIVNLLTGGTIQANAITKTASANSQATMNFDGGTLSVYSVNGGASFLTGLDHLFLYPGGLTLNTAGQNVTMSVPLTVPTGYGVGTSLSSIPVTSGGGAGYIAPPMVKFAYPASGIPATGVAQIDNNGTVTNILVTSPGSGYTSGQSVAITYNNNGDNSAGEAITAATGFNTTASTLNTSGGLTKNGNGTLTISGTSTYPGSTTVNGGSLVMSSVVAMPPVAGMAIWMDANATATVHTNSNGEVYQWDNQGVQGGSFTMGTSATSTTHPTYVAGGAAFNNLPVVNFAAASSQVLTNITGAITNNQTTMQVFLVMNRTSLGANAGMLSFKQASAANDYGNAASMVFADAGSGTGVTLQRSSGLLTVNIANSSTYVADYLFNSASGFLYLNGALQGSAASTGSFAYNYVALGGRFSAAGATLANYWNGQVAEILVYTNALTTGQRQAIEVYLGQKWAGPTYGIASLNNASPVSVTSSTANFGGSGIAGSVTVAANGGIQGGLLDGNGNSSGLVLSNLTFSGAGNFTVFAMPQPAVALQVTNSLVLNGLVTVSVANAPAPGTYHLLNLNTATGTQSFALNPTRTASLATNNVGGINYLDLVVIASPGYDVWTGTQTSDWSVNSYAPGYNWQLYSNGVSLYNTDFLTADTVVFNDSASNTNVNISVANVNPASTTFNNTNKNYVLAGPYGIANGSLTKTGAGTLTVSNVNTYGSGTTIAGGTVEFVNGGLGGGGVSLTGNSTLRWLGINPSTPAFSLGNGVNATFDTTANTVTYPAALGGTGSSVVKQGAGTLALNGNNAFTNAVTVNAGTLTLGGNNTFTGGATVNAGTLNIGSLGSLNSATPNTVLLNANNTTLQAINNSAVVGAVTVAAGVTNATLVANNTSATATTGFVFTNGITLNSPLTINYTRNSSQWDYLDNYQKITGPGGGSGNDSLIFTQTGSTGNPYYQFDGAVNNDFLGNVHVKSGTWAVQGFNGFAPGTTQIFPVGSMLILDSGTTWTWNNASAAFAQTVDGLAGSGTMSKNAVGYTLTINAVNAANNANRVFAGTLSGLTAPLTVQGTGTQVFAGSNIAYTAATTVGDSINSGGLRLVDAPNFASPVTINAPATLEVSNTVAWTWPNNLIGGGQVLKDGPGVLTIASTNSSYSGTNLIASGTENVSGDLGSTIVVVNSGGTLSGLGGGVGVTTGGGSTTVNNGGTVSALNYLALPLGTALTIGTTGTDTASFNFSGNGSAVPGYMTVNGPLTLNGTANIIIGGVVPQVVGIYPLITYNTSFSGTGSLGQPTLPPGYTGYVTNDTTLMQIELVLSKVDSLVWVGSPDNNWNLSNSNLVWKLASSGLPTYFVNNAVAAFDDTAANFTANVAAAVLPSSVSMSNTVNNYTFQGLPLSFSGTLLKDGTASLTLATSNNLGSMDLRNGTLVAADNEVFTNLIYENGTLQLGTGGSAGWVNLPSTLNLPTNTATLVFDRADDQSVGNTFTGNGSVLKLGADIVTLTARSTHASTTVGQGTLALELGGAQGTLGGTVTVNTNGVLRTDVADSLGYAALRTTNLVINGGTLNHTPASNLSLWGMTVNLTGGTMTASGSGSASLDLGTDVNAADTPTVVNTYTSTNASVISGNQVRLRQTTTTFTVASGTGADDLLITAPIIASTSGNGIDKEGAGTLTINSASTFNGGATVNGGLLKIVNDPSWASDISLTSPGALVLSNSVAWTFANAIGGNGSVTKSGTGTVTMTQNNGYSGTTTVNGGTLLVSGLSSSTSITIASGATFGGQGYVSAPVTIPNGSGLSAPFNASLSLNSLTLGANPTDSQTLAFSADLTGVDGNINVSTSFSQSGTNLVNVTGTLPLTVPATYTLITYPAYSAVNNGVFVLGSLPERGAGYLTNDIVNGLVQLVVTNLNGLEWVGSPTNTWDNAGTVDWKLSNNNTPASFVNNSDFAIFDDTASNFVVSASAGVNPVMAIVTNVNTYTFQGSPLAISVPFTVEGPGTTVLLANNNNFGALNVTGGTLEVGNGGTSGSFAATAVVNNNATLVFNRSDSATAANAIAGTGNLIQSGTGTLTLSGTNTYTGNTVVSKGTLTLNTAGVLPTTADVVLGDANTGTNSPTLGATYGYTINSLTVAANITNGIVYVNPTPANANVYLGTVTLNSPATFSGGNGGANWSQFIPDGGITGNGGGAGHDSLILTNANPSVQMYLTGGGTASSFLGNVHMTGGRVRLQTGATAIPATASLTMDSGTTLEFSTAALPATIDGLNGSGLIQCNVSQSSPFTVGESGGNGNFSGVIQNGTGSLAITKDGTGTQVLSGADTYTGATTVSNGTLAVNGSLASGSAVYVAPAGRLAGLGTVGGTVTVDGTLAPGTNGIGALTIANNLTLDAGSITTLAINRAAGTGTYGKVQGIGTANLAGTLTVTSLGGTFAGGDHFTLIGAGTYSGNFTTTNLPILGSGKVWNWNPNTGVLSVVTTVNTNPTNLAFTVTGSTLNLSWPADHLGWHLQYQTNLLTTGLGTNWITIPGSDTITATNITVNPAVPTVFYRLVYP
jgi:autotransporter-associated beta strand protein